MVTVISRPLGHKLTDAELSGVGLDSGSGLLQVTTLFAHGLVDGDYIYVQSNIEEYNGFKYVDSQSYDTFRLRQSADGDFVEYVQDTDLTYRISVLQHGYLAAAQPIVYELESNLWPFNEPEDSYTVRVVDSQSDAEGYTQLNLSTALNSPLYLDFIEVIGEGPLAGVYQILEVLQSWSVVINLAFDAGNSFAGYTVVKYYNNYCINVNVWSGLGIEHRWYSKKPFANAATLRFTPDENGRVKFSISDILRGNLKTRNNLTLGTLPNNLDFMAAFYIEYYESFDASNGEEIETLETAPVTDRDTFEGHAINADMPFKSLYQSHMSDYIHEDTYLAKWLILQTTPVAIVGYFFDISFINSLPRVDILINVNKSVNGVVTDTETITITNPGVGVIRVPLEVETGFDQYCIYAHTLGIAASDATPVTTLEALAGFTNQTFGWSLGAQPNVSVNGNGGVSNWLLGDIATTTGFDYSFTMQMNIKQSLSVYNVSITYALKNAAFGIIDSISFNYTGDGMLDDIKIETFSLTASADGLYLAVFITNNTPFATKTFYLEAATYNAPSPPTDSIPAQTITETICIKVREECDSTFIPDDDIRLTEDGDFRILE
jgi:hypothetical protein